MGHPVNPEPAGEPDTVFEPRDETAPLAEAEGRRRVVNLASHTGVGIAAAAGVIGVQRLQESGSEDVSDSAGLDVFEDAGEEPVTRVAGGMSASAKLVDSDPDPAVPSGTEALSLAADSLPDLLPETLHAEDVSAPVDFLPVASVDEPEAGPDILANFSTPDAVEGSFADYSDDVSENFEPENLPAEEGERVSSLANAGNEIGGGLVLDEIDASQPVFGASSEVGRLSVDEIADDDDESLASLP